MKPKKYRRITYYLNLLSNFLILSSLIYLFFTFAPVFTQEIKYQLRESTVTNNFISNPTKIVQNNYTDKKEIEPVNTNFSIIIPKLAASAPVFANIDPFNKAQYLTVLRKGVAHAKGSALPGSMGNVYIFAHSTDAFYNVGKYNAIFYLIGKLQKGDIISVYYKGEKFNYEVYDKKVVAPNDIKYLDKIERFNTLTLQTCYPPGTTFKRLIVLSKQI